MIRMMAAVVVVMILNMMLYVVIYNIKSIKYAKWPVNCKYTKL